MQEHITYSGKSKDGNIENRRLIIKNYIIIYQVNLLKKEVYLLHIFNSRKSYLKKFKSKIQLKIIV